MTPAGGLCIRTGDELGARAGSSQKAEVANRITKMAFVIVFSIREPPAT
jgi:hypothetical protein